MKLNRSTIEMVTKNLIIRQVKGNMKQVLSEIRVSQPEELPRIAKRYQFIGQSFWFHNHNRHLKKQILRSFNNKAKDGSNLSEILPTQINVIKDIDRSQDDANNILELDQEDVDKEVVKEESKQIMIDKDTHIKDDVFEEIRKSPYFIDKTLLIREIQTKTTFDSHLICGPRRMGKSVNLRMLYDYYAIYQTEPSRYVDVSLNPRLKLFKDTLIYQDKEMRWHFGRYPVIYFNLAIVKGNTFDEAKNKLIDTIENIRIRFEYLLKDKTLTESQIEVLRKPRNDIMRNPTDFIIKLCVVLKTYYGIAPMILIDEFDAPLTHIMENYTNKDDIKKTVDMYTLFFEDILKTNEDRNRAILTGVSRLSSSGLFSGWNNIIEYNFVDAEFVDYYGFKEQELHSMLDRQNYKTDVVELKRLFAEHYNGYNVKGTKIYNPYSVVRALKKINSFYRNGFDLKDQEVVNTIFDKYWVNTGSEIYLRKILSPLNFHFILKEFLDDAPVYSKLEFLRSGHSRMEEMGEFYETAIHEKYPSVNDLQSDADDILISFMVTLGYLTVGDRNASGQYKVYIPNKELKRGLQSIDKMLMKKFSKEGSMRFEEAKKLVAELLTVESTLIGDMLRNISVNFLHILLNLQKAVVEETKEIVSPGAFINERTLHHYIEWAAPKNNETFYATEWNLTAGRPDVVFAALDNRVVVIEAKYNNRNTSAGHEQTQRYADLIRQRLPQAKSVLCVVLNYINDDLSDRSMAIEYQYSLHQYDRQSILPAEKDNEGKGKVYISDVLLKKEQVK